MLSALSTSTTSGIVPSTAFLNQYPVSVPGSTPSRSSRRSTAICVLTDTGGALARYGVGRAMLMWRAVTGLTTAPGASACAAPVWNVAASPPIKPDGPPKSVVLSREEVA